MLETTPITRFPAGTRRRVPMQRRLDVSTAAPRSLRRQRCGIDARQSDGASIGQCQRPELERHRLRRWSDGVLAARISNTSMSNPRKTGSVSSRSLDTHAFLPVSLACAHGSD